MNLGTPTHRAFRNAAIGLQSAKNSRYSAKSHVRVKPSIDRAACRSGRLRIDLGMMQNRTIALLLLVSALASSFISTRPLYHCSISDRHSFFQDCCQSNGQETASEGLSSDFAPASQRSLGCCSMQPTTPNSPSAPQSTPSQQVLSEREAVACSCCETTFLRIICLDPREENDLRLFPDHSLSIFTATDSTVPVRLDWTEKSVRGPPRGNHPPLPILHNALRC